MLNIAFEFDESGFTSSTDAYLKGALQPALVGAVNEAAAQVARGLGGFLEGSLSKSTAFTRSAAGYLEADPYDEAPAALVFLKRRQAGYLGYEVFGGDRAPGDPGTLPGGVIVPMRDTTLDGEGNPDWEQVEADLADPRARWVALGPPGDEVLVRDEGGHTVFLLGTKPETHYDPTVDFFGWVTREAVAVMQAEVGAAIEAAGGDA